jgi:hypothetical protein
MKGGTGSKGGEREIPESMPLMTTIKGAEGRDSESGNLPEGIIRLAGGNERMRSLEVYGPRMAKLEKTCARDEKTSLIKCLMLDAAI